MKFMKQYCLFLSLLLLLPCNTGQTEPKPNFVLILGEGAGWTSTSVQMDDRNLSSKGSVIKTPNLERLAEGGMRFSDGYAASPRCTPSRAALFTGRSPAALHMTFIGVGRGGGGTADAVSRVKTPPAVLELPETETTLAELLKRAGYATAHFGKWHVGKVDPRRHGFDESHGATGNGGPENVANPNPKQALAMTADGINFMERQSRTGRPFYLQLSHYPSQEEKGGGGGRNRRTDVHAEEAEVMDRTIGQILDAIERLGLKGTTYILYTTDHGTPGRNGPLAGGKGTVMEGGLRVPFIVMGPGVKSGVCSHVRVSAMDILPTFAELAGIQEPMPSQLEGGSLATVLKHAGQGVVKRPREEFVVHFPHYDKDPQGPATAILLGDYKLIRCYENGVLKLFHLASDPNERNNLATEQPDRVKAMDQRLTDYLTAVKAEMPIVNASATPGASQSQTKGGRKNPDTVTKEIQ